MPTRKEEWLGIRHFKRFVAPQFDYEEVYKLSYRQYEDIFSADELDNRAFISSKQTVPHFDDDDELIVLSVSLRY